ncbi:MAG: hypothetical protein LBI71_00065 [Enterobacteriaceae bacterium]|jgi:hypothetical protein|nr:hypothetical protein [Enterobacteriaceae bacterium]
MSDIYVDAKIFLLIPTRADFTDSKDYYASVGYQSASDHTQYTSKLQGGNATSNIIIYMTLLSAMINGKVVKLRINNDCIVEAAISFSPT